MLAVDIRLAYAICDMPYPETSQNMPMLAPCSPKDEQITAECTAAEKYQGISNDMDNHPLLYESP